mmetsp:Transcript_5762/g.14078  ORF Transcript_5762/g.14078 Transcript_5762/m.14078 type:complete len:217 (+) Transcript_5762:479-1129(+)
MFSPILPIRPLRTSSTVGPKPSCDSGRADRAATSAGLCSATRPARAPTKARKASFLETKSVSQLTSISAPLPLTTADDTTPSAVMREAALPALLPSLTRRISSARPRSPSASVSAFLHSIIGASVRARSSPTMLAVIAAISVLQISVGKRGLAAPFRCRIERAQASSETSTNSSPAGATAAKTSAVALALPSSTASATARAYRATALAESSLPGMT